MYESPKIHIPYTKTGVFVYESPKIHIPYTKTGIFVYGIREVPPYTQAQLWGGPIS